MSIVGWTRATAFDHAGVFYNQEGLTVLPAYIAKARERNLPALYLPAVPDVDTMADLMHNVTLVEALNYCAAFDGNTPPWRTGRRACADGLERSARPSQRPARSPRRDRPVTARRAGKKTPCPPSAAPRRCGAARGHPDGMIAEG